MCSTTVNMHGRLESCGLPMWLLRGSYPVACVGAWLVGILVVSTVARRCLVSYLSVQQTTPKSKLPALPVWDGKSLMSL